MNKWKSASKVRCNYDDKSIMQGDADNDSSMACRGGNPVGICMSLNGVSSEIPSRGCDYFLPPHLHHILDFQALSRVVSPPSASSSRIVSQCDVHAKLLHL